MENSKKTFVLTDRARSEEQMEVLKEIEESGKCPFCTENWSKQLIESTLYQYGTQRWLTILNNWPYDNTKLHFVCISRVHAESLNELPDDAGTQLLNILQRIEKDYQIKSGAIFIRFGNPMYNGGSVNHLHAHIIVPDIGPNKDWEKIRVKLGTNPQ